MKSLRILTGHHAGAQIKLSHGQQRISSDEQADIQITDWQHAAVDLINTESGETMWKMATAEGKHVGMPQGLLLLDLIPQRFGDVVLCVGPADAVWPSDISLLSALMQKPMLVVNKSSRLLSRVLAVSGGAAMLAVGVVVLSLAYSGPGEGAKPRLPLSVQVARALAPADAARLIVKETGTSVVVEGLLDNSVDVLRVKNALQAVNGSVLHRYTAASDAVRTINEAAGSSQVNAEYQGDGVFLVSGQTADLNKLVSTLQRVAVDMDTSIKRINVQVIQEVDKKRISAGAIYTDKTLQYVQSRDGTRHFSVVVPEVEGQTSSFVDPASLDLPTGAVVSLLPSTATKRRP
jgi:type III secretion protein D